MNKTNSNRNHQLLDLYDQWGVDISLNETPRDLRTSASVAAKPVTPPPSSPFLSTQISDLQTRVRTVTTIPDLRALMESFDGCGLKKTATNLVFGEGAPNPLAMVIGEAPGADEDLQGRPFVGKSGQLLDNVLASIGLKRSTNTYIANIIPWRPPGNRPPTPQEVDLCLPFIVRHIELVQPKILILAGAVALKALLKIDSGIMRHRGQWLDYTTPLSQQTYKTMAIYHPAYLLRSPGQKAKAWQDMLQVQEFLETLL